MPGTQARLQIATKIHFFLLRELDHGIDIEKMLTSERYARDVLLVCQACKGTELALLAEQFQRAMPHVPAAPADTEPPADTTPGALPAQAPPPAASFSWLTRWIGR